MAPDADPGRARSAVAGALATGAGLGVGHAVAALLGPTASPVIAVGNRAVDLSPTPLKEWAIATFGAADKAVLLVGVVVVTLALGALVGLLARRSLGLGLAAAALLAAVAVVAASGPARPGAWFVPGLAALGAGGASRGRRVRPAATGGPRGAMPPPGSPIRRRPRAS